MQNFEKKEFELLEEKRRIRDSVAGIFSSQDFKLGKEKVCNQFVLSNGGGVINSNEDENGIVKIILNLKNGVVLDFSNLLPDGWKFVSPTFLIKSGKEKVAGVWSANLEQKTISVGEIKGTESVFALLHEIGHALDKEKMKKANEVYENYGESRSFNSFSSSAERVAWANAINLMRKLRDDGINLFEFIGWEDFRSFMYKSLADHRIVASLDEIQSAKETQKFVEKLGGHYKFEDVDIEYLKKLFDKNIKDY